jgi:hypothetical protein
LGGAGREQPIPSPQHCLCLGPLSGAHRTAGNGRLAPRRGGFPRPPSCLFVCCCVGRGPRRSASRPVGPVPKAIGKGKGPSATGEGKGEVLAARPSAPLEACQPLAKEEGRPRPLKGRKEMEPDEESRPTTIVNLGARGRGGIVWKALQPPAEECRCRHPSSSSCCCANGKPCFACCLLLCLVQEDVTKMCEGDSQPITCHQPTNQAPGGALRPWKDGFYGPFWQLPSSSHSGHTFCPIGPPYPLLPRLFPCTFVTFSTHFIGQ